MRAALGRRPALAVAGSACAGSGPDKAGGRSEPVAKPSAGRQAGQAHARHRRRAPGGRVRRKGEAAVRRHDPDRHPPRRQRDRSTTSGSPSRTSGRARPTSASVGARAWDTMGVTSFRALLAPFLVDSLELQRRVLESPLGARMLEGLEPLGLVGLALLPGPLRRPVGLTRPLVGPRDYAGATIGIRFGRVAQDTLEALGATPKVYRIGSLAGLDGAELDLRTIARNGYDARRASSRRTSSSGRAPRRSSSAVPRSTGSPRPSRRSCVAPAARRRRRGRPPREGAAGGARAVCARGKLSLATASPPSSRRCGRRQPVYDGSSATRDAELIAEIRKLRRGPSGESVRCAAARRHGLEGVWRSNVSARRCSRTARPRQRLRPTPGRGRSSSEAAWTSTASAQPSREPTSFGDAIRLTMRTCTANPCEPGATPSTRGASIATGCR